MCNSVVMTNVVTWCNCRARAATSTTWLSRPTPSSCRWARGSVTRDTWHYRDTVQDTDKTVRIECVFAADDQTVSFRPTAGSREDGGGISVT